MLFAVIEEASAVRLQSQLVRLLSVCDGELSFFQLHFVVGFKHAFIECEAEYVAAFSRQSLRSFEEVLCSFAFSPASFGDFGLISRQRLSVVFLLAGRAGDSDLSRLDREFSRLRLDRELARNVLSFGVRYGRSSGYRYGVLSGVRSRSLRLEAGYLVFIVVYSERIRYEARYRLLFAVICLIPGVRLHLDLVLRITARDRQRSRIFGYDVVFFLRAVLQLVCEGVDHGSRTRQCAGYIERCSFALRPAVAAGSDLVVLQDLAVIDLALRSTGEDDAPRTDPEVTILRLHVELRCDVVSFAVFNDRSSADRDVAAVGDVFSFSSRRKTFDRVLLTVHSEAVCCEAFDFSLLAVVHPVEALRRYRDLKRRLSVRYGQSSFFFCNLVVAFSRLLA